MCFSKISKTDRNNNKSYRRDKSVIDCEKKEYVTLLEQNQVVPLANPSNCHTTMNFQLNENINTCGKLPWSLLDKLRSEKDKLIEEKTLHEMHRVKQIITKSARL